MLAASLGTSLAALIQLVWPSYGAAVSLEQCLTPFELRLPFREASVWQDFNGQPASTLELEVGADGYSTRGFQVIEGQFVPGPTDTWFVYGLHGDLQITAAQPADADAYPQWNGRHAGIDFVAKPGLHVLAAADGRVTFAGDVQGFGGTVVVEHAGGFLTTYANLGSLAVRPGDRVYVGDQLGSVGGRGPIAHVVLLELDHRNPDGSFTAVNPLRYLNLAGALVPRTDANRFSRGSSDPAKQPDFSWERHRYLPV